MSEPNVTSLRRCPYCGAETKRAGACSACSDLPLADPQGSESGLPLELELELAARADLAIDDEREQDPPL